MKKFLILLILVFVGILLQAQNNYTNYKAVVANASGTVLTNQSVSVRFTIYDGANPVFTETHNTTTDTHGIIVLEMGSANPTDWNNLSWNSVPFSLKTEYNTGSGFTDMGTKPFQYVPYAKYASLANAAVTADYQNLTNKPDLFYVNTTTDIAQHTTEDIVHEGAMVLGIDQENPFTKLTINFEENSTESTNNNGILINNNNNANLSKLGYIYLSTTTTDMPDTAYTSSFSGNSNADKTAQFNQIATVGDGAQIGQYNTFSGSGNGLHCGVKNEFTGTSPGNMSGVLNWLTADGDGMHFGTSNLVQGNGSGLHSGTVNEILGMGTGDQHGVYNIIGTESTAVQYGVKNWLDNNGNGNHFGTYNELKGSGTGEQVGTFNAISLNGPTLAGHVGTKNVLNGSGLYRYGVLNQISGNQNTVFDYGVKNELSDTMSNDKYGIHNSLSGSGFKNGIYQLITQTGSAETRGVYTEIIAQSSGMILGNDNIITQNGNSIVIANRNRLVTGPDNSSDLVASQSLIFGSGTGTQYGHLTEITNTGNGIHYGIFTDLNGTGQGPQYALNNLIQNSGDAEHIGIVNTISGTGNGGQYGMLNQIDNTGINTRMGIKNVVNGTASSLSSIGVWNEINSESNSLHIGTRNGVIGNGLGDVYGTYNYITGTGSGNKVGSYTYIPATTGGTHYGVYSSIPQATGYAGYFLGNVYVSGTFTNPSDASLKENIHTATATLEKIKRLEVKEYTYKKSEAENYGLPRGKQTGFIAQEMETVFPELVQENTLHLLDENADQQNLIEDKTIKTVNYIGMIPLLTKAIQEQQAQIESYQQQNAAQQAKIEDLEHKLAQLIQDVEQLKK